MDVIHIIIIAITGLISAAGYFVAQLSKLAPSINAWNKMLADQHARAKELPSDTITKDAPSTINQKRDTLSWQAQAVSGVLISLGSIILLAAAFVPSQVSSQFIVLCSLSMIAILLGFLIFVTDHLYRAVLGSVAAILDGQYSLLSAIHQAALCGRGQQPASTDRIQDS